MTRLPDALDSPRAATFTRATAPALALSHRAGVRAGDSVLVLGAGGGVGLAAIGVARALGGRVLGVASSGAKGRPRGRPAPKRWWTRRPSGEGRGAGLAGGAGSTWWWTRWGASWPSLRYAPSATPGVTS